METSNVVTEHYEAECELDMNNNMETSNVVTEHGEAECELDMNNNEFKVVINPEYSDQCSEHIASETDDSDFTLNETYMSNTITCGMCRREFGAICRLVSHMTYHVNEEPQKTSAANGYTYATSNGTVFPKSELKCVSVQTEVNSHTDINKSQMLTKKNQMANVYQRIYRNTLRQKQSNTEQTPEYSFSEITNIKANAVNSYIGTRSQTLSSFTLDTSEESYSHKMDVSFGHEFVAIPDDKNIFHDDQDDEKNANLNFCHEHLHHSLTYKCSVCELYYDTLCRLHEHMQQHTTDGYCYNFKTRSAFVTSQMTSMGVQTGDVSVESPKLTKLEAKSKKRTFEQPKNPYDRVFKDNSRRNRYRVGHCAPSPITKDAFLKRLGLMKTHKNNEKSSSVSVDCIYTASSINGKGETFVLTESNQEITQTAIKATNKENVQNKCDFSKNKEIQILSYSFNDDKINSDKNKALKDKAKRYRKPKGYRKVWHRIKYRSWRRGPRVNQQTNNDDDTTDSDDNKIYFVSSINEGKLVLKRKPIIKQTNETDISVQHMCSKCKLIFSSSDCIQNHLLRHNGKFPCGVCSFPFEDLDHLISHVCKDGVPMQTNNVNVYYCRQCDMKTVEVEGLTAHVCIEKNNKQTVRVHQQPTLKTKTNTFYPSLKKVESNRSNNNKTPCGLCTHICENRCELFSHMMDHKFPYKCLTCGQLFATVIDKDDHQKYCVPWMNWKCRRCSEEFVYVGSSDHMCQQRFVCDKCGLACVNIASLTHHLTKHHIAHANNADENHEVWCFPCNKQFSKQTNYKIHLARVHSEKPRSSERVPCNECNLTFSTKSALRVHSVIHMDNIPVYNCKTCSATFRHPAALKKHNMLHTHAPTIMCDQCDKTFYSKWNLKAHMRQHTGDKPYVCHVCAQAFAHNVSKKNHIKKYH